MAPQANGTPRLRPTPRPIVTPTFKFLELDPLDNPEPDESPAAEDAAAKLVLYVASVWKFSCTDVAH